MGQWGILLSMEYKTGEVAKRVGVHANTIRLWAAEFERHLGPKANGGRRRFTEADVRVLATVAHLRDRGIDLADIDRALDNDETLLTELPPEPSPELEQARAGVRMVPFAQVERALDRIQQLEVERDRLTGERDSALVNNAELNEKIASLNREIGELQGSLKERQPATYWLRWLAVVVAVALVIVLALVVVLVVRGG